MNAISFCVSCLNIDSLSSTSAKLQLKPGPLSTLVVETEKAECHVFNVTRTVRDDVEMCTGNGGCKYSTRTESLEMSSVKSMGRGKGSQNETQKLFGYKGEPPTPTMSSSMTLILSVMNCCRFAS